MPRIYDVTSRSLLARLELIESEMQEGINLREELALMRVSANDVVQLYQAVYDKRDEARAALNAARDSGDEEAIKEKQSIVNVFDNAVNEIANTMRNVLAEVRDMAVDTVKIEAASKTLFTPQAVHSILMHTVAIMYEVCGDENEHLAETFEQLLRERINVAEASSDGTRITPDQDVLDMDNTVPALTHRV